MLEVWSFWVVVQIVVAILLWFAAKQRRPDGINPSQGAVERVQILQKLHRRLPQHTEQSIVAVLDDIVEEVVAQLFPNGLNGPSCLGKINRQRVNCFSKNIFFIEKNVST